MRFRILIGAAILCLMWGGGWPAMKIGLRDLPPFLYLGGRQLIVGVFFLALAHGRGIKLPQGMNLARSFGIGLVMTGVSNGLMFWGQQYITAGLASILFATMPFFVAGLAHLLLNERLNVWKVIGIAVGFSGVALLLSDGVGDQSPQALLGEAALLLSALCWALPLVLMKRWLGAEDPIALTGVQMLAGAVLLLPVGLMVEGIGRIHPTASALVAFSYMTVGAGAIGFSTYYWLARQMAASRLVLTSFVVPGVAVVLGVLLLGEAVEPHLFLGLGLIAAGIVVVNLLGNRQQEFMAAGAWVYVQASAPRYLLVKRTPAQGNEWTPVGGASEPGETPRQTALREAQEETGFSDWRRVIDLNYSYRFTVSEGPVRYHTFALQVDTERAPILDDEHEDYRWVDYDTAMGMVRWDGMREWLRRLYERVTGDGGTG